MSKRIVDLVSENNFVELKPILENKVAEILARKIEEKKAEYISELAAQKTAKKAG